MTTIVFFEKPGCANSSRQKRWHQAAGHVVEAHDLLAHPWTTAELRTFFGDRPVPQWFNRAAPRVKSGEVVPDRLDAEAALALMLADPLLIRRPLMVAEGRHEVGFDAEVIHRWLGLPSSVLQTAAARQPETCRKTESAPGQCSPKAQF